MPLSYTFDGTFLSSGGANLLLSHCCYVGRRRVIWRKVIGNNHRTPWRISKAQDSTYCWLNIGQHYCQPTANIQQPTSDLQNESHQGNLSVGNAVKDQRLWPLGVQCGPMILDPTPLLTTWWNISNIAGAEGPQQSRFPTHHCTLCQRDVKQHVISRINTFLRPCTVRYRLCYPYPGIIPFTTCAPEYASNRKPFW